MPTELLAQLLEQPTVVIDRLCAELADAYAEAGHGFQLTKVAGGYRHSVAVRNDGTLWAWGSNFWGQLGDGTTETRTSPVQIGSAANWAVVACGISNTVAVKTDGTLWVWGGDSTSSPTRMGLDSNWVTVAAGSGSSLYAAVKADGTLWAWGYNGNGQVGDGTTTNRPSPVRIGTATNWIAVSCGYSHGMASKSDGTLWAWGVNTYGELGDGTTSTRLSPVQCGTGNAWGKLPARLGSQYSTVLTLDGKMWACGNNAYGELGTVDPSVHNRMWPLRVPQILSLPALPALAVGQPVALSATAPSQLPVRYGVVGPATLNGNILTPTGTGTVEVIAWQPGDATWASTEPLRRTQTVTPSNNANLTNLALSAGTLTPAFVSLTTDYAATVGNTTATLTVKPTVDNLAATVRVNGVPVVSGTASAAIPLALGGNSITVVVTAQDGVTTRTYTVNVTRQSAIVSWRQTYFGNATAFTGDLQDFDHDGVLNLFEFAFGTDPTVHGGGVLVYNGTLAGGGAIGATGQPTTVFEPTATGIDYRALFVRRKDYAAAGLTYTPQFSADMLTWANSAAVPAVLADDGTYQIGSVPYPPFVGGKKARFFRISVTLAP